MKMNSDDWNFLSYWIFIQPHELFVDGLEKQLPWKIQLWEFGIYKRLLLFYKAYLLTIKLNKFLIRKRRRLVGFYGIIGLRLTPRKWLLQYVLYFSEISFFCCFYFVFLYVCIVSQIQNQEKRNRFKMSVMKLLESPEEDVVEEDEVSIVQRIEKEKLQLEQRGSKRRKGVFVTSSHNLLSQGATSAN